MQPALLFAAIPYLFPLVPAQNVPGANGSLWSTELVIENSSDHTITLQNTSCVTCAFPPPPGGPVVVPPQSTVTNPMITQTNALGAILFLDDADAPFIRMHERVRDMSRESQTYGTEIPIVPDTLFRPTVRLIDVPADPRFRVTLRIYTEGFGVTAHVTVLPPNGTTPLRTITVPLGRYAAQLDPVSGLGASSVRVIVDADAPLWAFISVTDNDTQDVTTITESR